MTSHEPARAPEDDIVIPAEDIAAQPFMSLGKALSIVVGTLALAGALVGALWSVLAPPVHGVVALTKSGERAHAYLGSEGDHFFVAAVMMLGMLTVVSAVAAVAVWQWRAHRGPAMVVALAIGSILGAAVATAAGTGLARLRYDAVDVATAPVSPEHRVHYFTEAPSVFFGHSPSQMATTLLMPAAVAALVYAVLTVSALRDDLGAYPPQEPPLVLPPRF